MAIYEYQCLDCKKEFEAIRPMNQADQPIACVDCQSQNTRRMLSSFNAHGDFGTITRSSDGCGACVGGSCATCNH